MSRTGRVAILDKPEGTFTIEEKPLPEDGHGTCARMFRTRLLAPV